MNFLQPLQYQSMFVPSNIDLMNQQINKREQEYAQNEAMMAAAQDKYQQIASDPTAVEYKNQLMDQFSTEMQGLSDQYGGDLGAIDKRSLVDRINTIRPEIQRIQQHKQLVDQERTALLKGGNDAYLKSSVGDFNTFRENQGGQTVLGSISEDQKYIDDNFGDMRTMLRQTGMYDPKTIEGILQQKSTKGLTQEEASIIGEQMYQQLISKGTPDEIAKDIAFSKSQSLIQGDQYGHMRNPNASEDGGDDVNPYGDIITTASGIKGTDVTGREKFVKRALKETGIFTNQTFKNNIEGKVGTSGFNVESEDPIVRAYQNSVNKSNPELYEKSKLPYNSGRISEMAKRYGVSEDEIKKIISGATVEAEAQWKSNKEIVEEDALLKGITTGIENYTNNFTDIHKERLENRLDGKFSGLNYRDRNALIKEINKEYSTHNKEVNDEYEKAWNNKLETGEEEILKQFDFKSYDTYNNPKAKKRLADVNSEFNRLVSPSEITFHTGEYAGESSEDISEEFKDEDGKFNIVGVGGDADSGLLFAIVDPKTKEKSMVSLSTPIESQVRLAASLGGHKAAYFAFEKQVADKMENLQPLGKTGYIYNTDGENHMISKEGGDILTNKDIAKINKKRVDNDLEELRPTGNPDDPYKFEFVLHAIETANLLK